MLSPCRGIGVRRFLAVGRDLDEGAGERGGDVADLRQTGRQRQGPAAGGEVLVGLGVDREGGRRQPRLEEALGEVGVLAGPHDGGGQHQDEKSGGGDGHEVRGAGRNGREEIEAAGPLLGVADQAFDQLRRAVELVAARRPTRRRW